MSGTVIDVQVFTREGIERDKRAQQIIDDELKGYRRTSHDQLRIVENDAFERIERLLIGKTANGGPKKLAKGAKITKAVPRRTSSAIDWFDIRLAADDASQQMEQLQESLEADAGAVRPGVRGEEEEAHAGRRAAAGRAEDGEGLRRGEAPPAAGRQDGRPPRQQGRDLEDRAGRGHAVHGGRHAGRHRAESARRAFADERRPDPRDPPRLGGEGPGPADRRDAEGAAEAPPRCASSSSKIYNSSGPAGGPRVARPTRRSSSSASNLHGGRAVRDAGVRRRDRGRDQGHARSAIRTRAHADGSRRDQVTLLRRPHGRRRSSAR